MGYQVVSLPFGQGLDTKTDSKMLSPPKVALLQDCIFTNIQRLTKRNGYNVSTNALIGGGTWSNPTMVRSYKNQLVIAASTSNGPRLLSYSDDFNAWQDKGQYQSVAVSKQIVNGSTFTATSSGSSINTAGANTSGVVIGDIALFAFDYGPNYGKADATNLSFITVVDLSTGMHLVDELKIPNALGFSKAIVLGPSTFAVAYISSTATDRLAFVIVTVSSAGVSIGSEIVVGHCKSVAVPGTFPFSFNFPYSYDFATSSNGGTFVVPNGDSNQLNLYQFSNTGIAGATANIAQTGAITPVSINQDVSGQIWVYWIHNSGQLKYSVYSSNLGSNPVNGVIISSSLSRNAGAMQLTATATATQQTVYCSGYNVPNSPDPVYAIGGVAPTIFKSIVNNSGSVILASQPYLQGFDINGKIYSVNGRFYLPTVSLSYGAGGTGLLMDIDNALPVSKYLQTSAEGLYTAGFTLGGSFTAPIVNGVRYPGFINSSFPLSSTQFLLANGVVISTFPLLNSLVGGTNLDATPVETQTGGINLKPCYLTFDFNHIDAYQGLIQQDTLVLNGGVISMYDGSGATELQYNVDPDNMFLLGSTTGGSYATGTLIYYATYEWIDANGNLYESAPSPGAKIIFTSGSTNSVQGAIAICSASVKKDVSIKIWRSDSTLGGNLAYCVATISNTGFLDNAFATFTDTFSTAEAQVQPTLYTQGGSILENLSPPPAMIMWLNNNRIWAVDSENPETTIEYCKTASIGTGISFSTGFLETVIDSRFGAITGASQMDEKTVILKQNGIGYFIGDGANDAGTGSSITNFQFIPSDTGCSNSKSVVLFPEGLLFKTTKGIYLVSRGVQVSYFGQDVEAYNSQDVQSAFIVPNRNQIRFLTSSGSSLLYDYVFNKWSIFTNHAGLSADVFQGNYVYVRSDGSVYLEDQSGTYLDNGSSYAPLIQMSWIKASDIQGFQRTRRAMLLGDFKTANGGHGVQISTAYDFNPNFSAPVPYYFSGPNNIPYQYRERLKRQKFDSFQLQIQEIVTGASGEYIDFNDLAIEILAKTGLNKLSGFNSVG